MKYEANDPKKAGQPASKKVLFGDNSRYAAQAIHTRFDAVEWFVWDAQVPYGEKPVIIRQSGSYGEAVGGLIDTPCQSFFEDTYICDDFGQPKGQCGNCGFHESEHEKTDTSTINAERDEAKENRKALIEAWDRIQELEKKIQELENK